MRCVRSSYNRLSTFKSLVEPQYLVCSVDDFSLPTRQAFRFTVKRLQTKRLQPVSSMHPLHVLHAGPAYMLALSDASTEVRRGPAVEELKMSD